MTDDHDDLDWFYDCDKYGRQTYEAPAMPGQFPGPRYLVEGSYGDGGACCSYGDQPTYEAAVAHRDQLIRDGAGPTVEGHPPYTHWRIDRVSTWVKIHEVDGSHVVVTPAKETP